MHQYEVRLTDDSVLFFKSKHNVCRGRIQILLVHNRSFLVFDDADLMLNIDKIKNIAVDGVEFKEGNYIVH